MFRGILYASLLQAIILNTYTARDIRAIIKLLEEFFEFIFSFGVFFEN
jgi:hypothetical protein